ncbi:MAG: hypothetical protein K2W96_06915 [Gemmataceae bacterium]|nr:hypothetical protein [Gemmataceae bacterium]
MRRYLLSLGALALSLSVASACSLCGGAYRSTPTLRQEAGFASARMILHGAITDSSLDKGESDFDIKSVLRDDKSLKGKKKIVLGRWMPVEDKKNPPQYLLFCDVDRKGTGVDPYRGIPVRGPRTIDYVKKALALDKKDVAGNLVFFFGYLDDSDPEVARDAFLEFARADDADIIKAAPKLDAAKLRKWLADPKTPAVNNSVYAMLLGACGKAGDAALLTKLLDSAEDRYQNAADGLMAGLVALDARKGWAMVQDVVSDGRKPLSLRMRVTGTLRFLHGAKPKESKAEILKAMKSLLLHSDLADMAIADLASFKLWDLTKDVLACHGKKGYESPLLVRAIYRYALSAPATEETKAFLDARRKDDPETLKEAEEVLRLERAG